MTVHSSSKRQKLEACLETTPRPTKRKMMTKKSRPLPLNQAHCSVMLFNQVLQADFLVIKKAVACLETKPATVRRFLATQTKRVARRYSVHRLRFSTKETPNLFSTTRVFCSGPRMIKRQTKAKSPRMRKMATVLTDSMLKAMRSLLQLP